MKKIIVYGCWLFFFMLWGIKNVFASGTIYVDGIAIGVPSDRFNRPNSMVENTISDIFVGTPNPQGNTGAIYLSGRVPFKQLCNNTNADYGGWHYVEVKFHPYSGSLDSYFNTTLFVDTREIEGTEPGQLVKGNWGFSHIYFNVKLTLKDDVYYKMSEQTISPDNKIMIMTMFCRNTNIQGNFSDQAQFHNKFTAFRVKVNKPIDFSLNRTCTIVDQQQIVNLRTVLLKDLEPTNSLVKGGNFNIKLDCNLAKVNSAYISFADGLAPTQIEKDFLITQRNNTMIRDIGMKIKDSEDGQFLKFNNLPKNNMMFVNEFENARNTKLFGQDIQGKQVNHNYEVYYFNRGGATVGKVKAKLLYNIYYH
ncbi:fimbrial protein [Avibacterium paragallinarum]|uniref:fimbrial protein n=1 Tax=Avibacterium paragallinarum TaxID=728 RepID=UPI00398715F1